MGSKMWIRFMEHNSDFLFCLLLFFDKSLENTKQNSITFLHLLETDSKKQGMESEGIVEWNQLC